PELRGRLQLPQLLGDDGHRRLDRRAGDNQRQLATRCLRQLRAADPEHTDPNGHAHIYANGHGHVDADADGYRSAAINADAKAGADSTAPPESDAIKAVVDLLTTRVTR